MPSTTRSDRLQIFPEFNLKQPNLLPDLFSVIIENGENYSGYGTTFELAFLKYNDMLTQDKNGPKDSVKTFETDNQPTSELNIDLTNDSVKPTDATEPIDLPEPQIITEHIDKREAE